MYLDVFNHVHRDGEYITFEEAVKILKEELKYPEDRALYFVKKFDKNNDGKLSASEFNLFKKNIEETLVRTFFCFLIFG